LSFDCACSRSERRALDESTDGLFFRRVLVTGDTGVVKLISLYFSIKIRRGN
jgi:hypothetical protein